MMLLAELDITVGSLHTGEINQGIPNLLDSLERLVTSPDITNALAALRPTLDQYRELGAKLTGRIGPLADSLTDSLAQADRALTQVRGAGEISPFGPLVAEAQVGIRNARGPEPQCLCRDLPPVCRPGRPRRAQRDRGELS